MALRLQSALFPTEPRGCFGVVYGFSFSKGSLKNLKGSGSVRFTLVLGFGFSGFGCCHSSSAGRQCSGCAVSGLPSGLMCPYRLYFGLAELHR